MQSRAAETPQPKPALEVIKENLIMQRKKKKEPKHQRLAWKFRTIVRLKNKILWYYGN